MLEPITKYALPGPENDHWVNQGAVRLTHLSGYSAAAGFVQVHDFADEVGIGTASIVAIIKVGAASNWSWDIPATGIPFNNGVHVALSSTAATYTAVAGTDLSVVAAWAQP